MQKIIVITGPTASGKSELAVNIAKKIGGEIISADSRQIYRGLTIGTGKVTGRWRTIGNEKLFLYRGVIHHCIDFVSPRRQFSAAEYQECATEAIRAITARGHVPIIAGGTGFWIEAVVYDLALPEVKPNKRLRKSLEKKNPAELFRILARLDPRRAEEIDPQNPRRLIRAIEIATALGHVPRIRKKAPYAVLWLAPEVDPAALMRTIAKRLDVRIAHGMIKEARTLRREGLSWKRFFELGLEYKYMAQYLQGQLSRNNMREELLRAIRHYARRQMTWFARVREMHWIRSEHEAMRLALIFLGKKSFATPPRTISRARRPKKKE